MASGIKVTIDLDETQAIRALKALNEQLGNTEKAATKASGKFDNAVGSFLGNLAAIGATKALQFLKEQFLEAFDTFAQFEQGLIDVAKTANLSQAEIGLLAEGILKISEVVPASTEELLDIATAAGQLGVKGTKNLALFTDTIAKLGRVSNLSGGEAATTLTRILNVTGEGIETIDNFASIIVSLGNNFAASESEIASMTNEVARATAQFGVGAGEAAALSAVLTSVGVRAEEAGGVLSKAFVAINKTIQGGGSKLQDLADLMGITGEEAEKAFGDNASKFFRDFVASLGNAEGGIKNAASTLEQFGISGIRVQKVLPVLSQNVGELDRALGLMSAEGKSSTALNEEFGRSLDTTTSKVQLLENAIERAQIVIGEKLAKAFGVVAPFLTAFFDNIGKSHTQVFAESTDDVIKLGKELEILQKKLKAQQDDKLGIASFFGDTDEVKEQIKVISDRLKELSAEEAVTTLSNLKTELATLNKELTVADPLLGVNSILGNEAELTSRRDLILEQIKNIETAAIMSGDKIVENDIKNANAKKIILTDQEQFRKDMLAVSEQEDATKAENALLLEEIKAESGFMFLAEQLGKENAIKEVARIKNIENETKREAAYSKLREKARVEESKKKKALEEQEKANKMSTIATLASMETGSSVELFRVKQVAAIASAYMNTSEAVTKALTLGPILGPIAAVAIGASGAIQIANISRQKPPSGGKFAEGGIVGGNSFNGDRLNAQVNSGEMIFNKRQQENLFKSVDSGNLGGGGSVVINNPTLLEEGAINAIIDQINDALEFKNKELGSVT